MWNVRAMTMRAVPVFVHRMGASDIMRDVFVVSFSNMLARLMVRTVARRFHSRVVRLQAFSVCMSVRFVGFAARCHL
jgi:hypothetical protein